MSRIIHEQRHTLKCFLCKSHGDIISIQNPKINCITQVKIVLILCGEILKKK